MNDERDYLVKVHRGDGTYEQFVVPATSPAYAARTAVPHEWRMIRNHVRGTTRRHYSYTYAPNTPGLGLDAWVCVLVQCAPPTEADDDGGLGTWSKEDIERELAVLRQKAPKSFLPSLAKAVVDGRTYRMSGTNRNHALMPSS